MYCGDWSLFEHYGLIWVLCLPHYLYLLCTDAGVTTTATADFEWVMKMIMMSMIEVMVVVLMP